MAIKKIFPIADTTLYSAAPSTNAGLDEMLEIGTYNDKSGIFGNNVILGDLGIDDIRRTLIQFDNLEISRSLAEASSSVSRRDTLYNITSSITSARRFFSASQLMIDGATASFYGTYIGPSGSGYATFSYVPGQVITGSVIANNYSASRYFSTSSYTVSFNHGALIPSGVIALHSGSYLTPRAGELVSQSFVAGTVIGEEAYASSFITASSSIVNLGNILVEPYDLIPAQTVTLYPAKYQFAYNSFPVSRFYASGAIVTSGSYAIEYYSASATFSGFYGNLQYSESRILGFSGSSIAYNYIAPGFSGSYLSESIRTGSTNFRNETRLRLFLATADNLTTTYTIEANPLAQNWVNGLGKYNDAPTNTAGTSWAYRSSKAVGNRWIGNNLSITQSLITRGGGAWYTGYQVTQSFYFSSNKDVNMDVTRIIRAWTTASSGNNTYRPNLGFIVKFPFQSSYIVSSSNINIQRDANQDISYMTASFAGQYYISAAPTVPVDYAAGAIMPSGAFAYEYVDPNAGTLTTEAGDILETQANDNLVTAATGSAAFSGSITLVNFESGSELIYEANRNSYNGIKFYSMNTHTIYPPCLEFKWDDYSFRTGSYYVTCSDDSYVVLCNNNLGSYQGDTTYRFNFRARDRYPARDFTTSSFYLDWKYLPPQTSYAIQDYKTKEMAYDFDTTYTKLSVDENGSYFNLDMAGLQPERSYKILLKSTLQTGETIIKDEDIIFKVLR